ncbi:hypothetical protein ABZ776_38105 [Streptomyces sp. NPDC007076]|uniref:hypothetical protein n=1 Tax=unclassified Streptomyces TaxID=2593676 RepID=UPI00225138ED|nr:hypothetical protein [Streptomyces sp. NBC_01500]MCX4553654.1 hypothetical protein [Streptomyces sp. NBC_01500]
MGEDYPAEVAASSSCDVPLLGHSILVSVWHMLTHDTNYQDLDGDYFLKLTPDRAARAAVRKLRYQVTLNPVEAS